MRLALTPTSLPTLTSSADRNFFSVSTSGSLWREAEMSPGHDVILRALETHSMVRPINLLREPTVLRKFDVSCVFAASPRMRDLGPNATRELHASERVRLDLEAILVTRGLRRSTVRDFVDENVDTTVASGTDLEETRSQAGQQSLPFGCISLLFVPCKVKSVAAHKPVWLF